MKISSRVSIPVAIAVVVGLTLLGLGVVFHYYESRYTGALPVITYPYREYALPVGIAGVTVLALSLLALLLTAKRKK